MRLKQILLGAVLQTAAVSAIAGNPNLVPDKPATAPNYWCTWYAQNYWIGRGQDLQDLSNVKNKTARESLNYDTVFNKKDGWATNYLPRGRKDYVFLIDHGWQTNDKEKWIAGGTTFFNMIANEDDFPQYAGMEPKKLLKKFNEEIKALGWNSLGLWTRGTIEEDSARAFVEWSKYAGIRYWKIDGGGTEHFYSYKIKKEIYPELVLEYVTGAGGNLNPDWDNDQTAFPSVYEIGGSRQEEMLHCVKNMDVFRTYDATPLLMSATTLRRTHDILKQTQQQPEYIAVLNVQDDCNLAVGLGVLVASKRHPNMGERLYKGKDLHHQLAGPRLMQKRMNEVGRFGRWARIAPAFPAGEGTYAFSDTELIDRCEFTPWDTWNKKTYGKMVRQSAPAIIARNMPLPKVEAEGIPPFVAVSTYPNGPVGIATEGRVTPEKRWSEPRARVTVKIKDASQPIGVIGHYKELVLEFADSLNGVTHVYAQDLLADSSEDIKSQVAIKGNTLTISGELIARIGTSAGDEGDLSAPGMVLKLAGTSLPVAGADYLPKVKPVTVAQVFEGGNTEEVKKPGKKSAKNGGDTGGYTGAGTLVKNKYGYSYSANEQAITLKPLGKSLGTGKHTITWKMKPAKGKIGGRNGFIVLSSDKRGMNSVMAGSWIKSGAVSAFERNDDWKGTKVKHKKEKELKCKAVINMDERTIAVTIGGETVKESFSESVTSVSYIGFGVNKSKTLFTEPKIKSE